MDNLTRICDYCKRNVSVTEAIIDNRIYYHDPCFYTVVSKKLVKLKRKIDNGQVTAQEIREYSDLQDIMTNKKVPTGVIPTNHKNIKLKDEKHNYLICRPEHRARVLHSVMEDDFKRLEESRSLRWAHEHTMITDGVNTQDQIEILGI
jgi:hypothetical protein